MKELGQHKRVVLLIPEPFSEAWNELIDLCLEIKRFDHILPTCDRWPVLALAIKAAHTTLSIATLAAMRQWPDAWVLGRSLFETEILVKWLLESETEERIKAYLAEIEKEKKRIRRKMAEGLSVAAQVMRDLIPPEDFEPEADATDSISRKRESVRERARRTNLDRSYDLPYWIASVFAHSHALSLAQWNPALKAVESPFVDMFGFHEKGFACWLVLEGIPMSALDTFQLANHHFDLNLTNSIKHARESFCKVLSKVSGGQVRTSSEIEWGEVRFEFEDGTVRSYKANPTGKDPLDELL
jgi:hypothetical protein